MLQALCKNPFSTLTTSLKITTMEETPTISLSSHQEGQLGCVCLHPASSDMRAPSNSRAPITINDWIPASVLAIPDQHFPCGWFLPHIPAQNSPQTGAPSNASKMIRNSRSAHVFNIWESRITGIPFDQSQARISDRRSEAQFDISNPCVKYAGEPRRKQRYSLHWASAITVGSTAETKLTKTWEKSSAPNLMSYDVEKSFLPLLLLLPNLVSPNAINFSDTRWRSLTHCIPALHISQWWRPP